MGREWIPVIFFNNLLVHEAFEASGTEFSEHADIHFRSCFQEIWLAEVLLIIKTKKESAVQVVGDIQCWDRSLYCSYKASKSDRAEVLEVWHKSLDILDQLNKSHTLLQPMIFDIHHNTLRLSYIWLCSRNFLVKIAFPSNGYFGFSCHFCFFSTISGLRLLKKSRLVSVALTSQRYFQVGAANCIHSVHK